VSEGIKIDGDQIKDDAMGNRRLGGVGVKVARILEEKLVKLLGKDNFGVRYQQAGYIPRMGQPSLYDLELADALGSAIGIMLREDKNGELPFITEVVPPHQLKDRIGFMPLNKVKTGSFPINNFYDPERFCLTPQATNFLLSIVDYAQISNHG
jgi:6-phosphofructokinase